MNRNPKTSMPNGRRAQRGVALIVVLLLLVVVTLLGLAAIRGSLLQERMSGNLASRSEAFQTAEAVLRAGESNVAAGGFTLPAAGAGCSNGLCGMPTMGEKPDWQASGFWDTKANYITPIAPDANHPWPSGSTVGYVIEDMGQGTDSSSGCATTSVDLSADSCSSKVQRYRITAYTKLANGTEVTLQSRYQK